MQETVLISRDLTRQALFKMFSVLALCMVAQCLSPARAHLTVCNEAAQCPVGYYCEMDAYICRECLSCQDLKREPPLAVNTCIKSVVECGSCNKGLVVDQRGDVNAECVPPDSSQLVPTPNYVWVLIGIGVLLFLALVVGIITYLLRNPEIFKTVGSNPSSTVTRITASAPEAPPPYNPLPYTAVRTESPYPAPLYSDADLATYKDDDRPFIKRSSPPRPNDARESAGNQAARVYDKPIYEREPRSPSPESPEPEHEHEHVTLPIHDEDTAPSPWVPTGPVANGDANDNNAIVKSTGASLPALLAAARDTTLVEPSAAKRRCLQQDSNNNRNRESNSCGDSSPGSFPRSPSPSQGGPPYNFITQITNVVQFHTGK